MAVTDLYPGKRPSQEQEPALVLVPGAAGQLATESALADLGAPVSSDQYHLSPEEMNVLEAELFAEIRPQIGDSPIAVAVVPHDSRYADFGRTSETEAYKGYDNHAAMAPYEEQSFFLYTFDTATGTVAHAKRIVRAKTTEELDGSGLTGLEIIDDRLKATGKEHAELADIMAYHDIEDTATVWNVAANHIMRRQGGRTGLPYTEASYLSLFRLTRENGINAIIAYVNDEARTSLFEKANLEYSLLGGEEYHLPEDPSDPADSHYDQGYVAVCIKDTEHNVGVFDAIPMFVPETDAPIVRV